MQHLYVNKLSSEGIQLPAHISPRAEIALKSVIVFAGWANLWSDISVNLKKVDDRAKEPEQVVYLTDGFYTPEKFVQEVAVPGILTFELITVKNLIKMNLNKNYKMNAYPAFYKLLGMRAPEKKWLPGRPEGYFASPKFYEIKTLRLYCDELDDAHNYVQEGLEAAKSKVFQHLPLYKEYKFGDAFTYTYEQLDWKPLLRSTNRLHFKLTDEWNYQDLPIEGIRLDLLIRDK